VAGPSLNVDFREQGAHADMGRKKAQSCHRFQAGQTGTVAASRAGSTLAQHTRGRRKCRACHYIDALIGIVPGHLGPRSF